MDKKSVELSRTGLDVLGRQVSGDYQEIRRRLMGHLAASGATITQIRASIENESQNKNIIAKFVRCLPSLGSQGSEQRRDDSLRTRDPYELKMIQSNIVWVKTKGYYVGAPYDRNGDMKVHRPNVYEALYVVGARTTSSDAELMVADSHGNVTRLQPARSGLIRTILNGTPQPIRAALNAMEQTERSEYPTPEVARELYTDYSGCFIVGPHSPGSTRLRHVSQQGLDAVSDELLGQFDVNSHLHKLAVVFGLQSQLDEILQQSASAETLEQ